MTWENSLAKRNLLSLSLELAQSSILRRGHYKDRWREWSVFTSQNVSTTSCTIKFSQSTLFCRNSSKFLPKQQCCETLNKHSYISGIWSQFIKPEEDTEGQSKLLNDDPGLVAKEFNLQCTNQVNLIST